MPHGSRRTCQLMDAIERGGCAGRHLHGASRYLSRACMIALGHLQTFPKPKGMFALPQKADVGVYVYEYTL
jgi:hypothetical protein